MEQGIPKKIDLDKIWSSILKVERLLYKCEYNNFKEEKKNKVLKGFSFLKKIEREIFSISLKSHLSESQIKDGIEKAKEAYSFINKLSVLLDVDYSIFEKILVPLD